MTPARLDGEGIDQRTLIDVPNHSAPAHLRRYNSLFPGAMATTRVGLQRVAPVLPVPRPSTFDFGFERDTEERADQDDQSEHAHVGTEHLEALDRTIADLEQARAGLRRLAGARASKDTGPCPIIETFQGEAA
ncbi:hypothetical protein [Brevundimonas aurifodinae]|uniref:hypothetical protein n=1 Tax=Brevundimonas aurifodinae TaxID=1508312 RepID=UPI003D80FD4E